MSGAKEIRTKIKSVASTQKITKAMEMVAASKMRKAQDRMLAAQPYAKHIEEVIAHLAYAQPEYRHPYTFARPVKTEGIVIVSSDRGLCGGLNVNLLRHVVTRMEENNKKGIKTVLCVFGSKAESFFKNKGAKVLAAATRMGDTPSSEEVVGPVNVMLDAFAKGEIDRLSIASNMFVNTMTQQPQVKTLIPIVPEEFEHVDEAYTSKGSWDYLYEPDAKFLLDQLMYRFIESLVYRAVVENFACEQAARMLAMKSATDNAGELIDGLQLAYNKARQASITKELSEIVSGAEAV